MITMSDSNILQNTSRELVVVKYLESIRPQIVSFWEFRQLPGLGYGRLSRSLRLEYLNNSQIIFQKIFVTGIYSYPDDMLKEMKRLLDMFVTHNENVKNINPDNFKLVIFPEYF